MNILGYNGLILCLAWGRKDPAAFTPTALVTASLSQFRHCSSLTDPSASQTRMTSTAGSSHPRRKSAVLFVGDSNKDDKDDTVSSPILERTRIDGVSVSPKGFHVLLETSRRRVVPLKVTNDPADSHQATSPESLTLCQLLSGVDMAGAILPPESLSRLLVHHVEEKLQDLLDDRHCDDGSVDESGRSGSNSSIINDAIKGLMSPQEQKVLDLVKKALPENQEFYKDAHPWFQSRIRLPQVTLDQLTLVPVVNEDYKKGGKDDAMKVDWQCRLECALPEVKDRIVIDVVKPDILAPLAFNYDPESSLLFTCLALALRYKAPIVLEQSSLSSKVFPTVEALDRDFPQRTTVSKLQLQSTRVAENIERGFEIHKLTGALQIAMRLGDEKAAARIRAKLDDYDSLHGLPTTSSGQVDLDDRTSLDDVDKNILQ